MGASLGAGFVVVSLLKQMLSEAPGSRLSSPLSVLDFLSPSDLRQLHWEKTARPSANWIRLVILACVTQPVDASGWGACGFGFVSQPSKFPWIWIWEAPPFMDFSPLHFSLAGSLELRFLFMAQLCLACSC